MAGLPQARWMAAAAAAAARGGGGGVAPVALNDAEAILQAVRAGLGRSLLPRVVGDGDPGLRRVQTPGGSPPLPAREVWLLAHPDLRPLARVATVVEWLERTVRARGDGA
jgi:DNA-binding transcriptional LysR family regulator